MPPLRPPMYHMPPLRSLMHTLYKYLDAIALYNPSGDHCSLRFIIQKVVASYDQRGTLAQYAASRSCQKAVDAADTALRGALTKLAVSSPSAFVRGI